MRTICEGERVLLLDRDGWEYVERKKGKEAVAVIAETDAGELILTEQFRKPVNARVIDFPAGLVGDTEGSNDPEETGYSCESVELLTTGPSSAGITSELVRIYRARGGRKTGEGGGVGGESITVHAVARNGLRKWLYDKEQKGVLIDLKVGLYLL
jgi:ADP-ribose pyrophosphatase